MKIVISNTGGNTEDLDGLALQVAQYLRSIGFTVTTPNVDVASQTTPGAVPIPNRCTDMALRLISASTPIVVETSGVKSDPPMRALPTPPASPPGDR